MNLDAYFQVGITVDLGSHTFQPDEIKAFAAKYDPQPFHLDEEKAAKSVFGRLCASGWHTCSIFMRMMCDAFVLDSTSQGAPGVDYAKWRKPVLAGDTLTGRTVVTGKRLSAKRPTLGFVTCRHELVNQRGEIVLEMANTGMFLTRDGVAA